jgi:excisionase family DNA binding protein
MTDLPNKAFLRPEEVAKWLDIPVKTLYGWIAEGKVPADRIAESRILRIRREVAIKLAQPVVS